MKKECRTVLLIGFIIYLVLEVIDIIATFNIKGTLGISKFSSLYISITNVILLTYIWDRGEGIAKVGLGCMLVNLLIDTVEIMFASQLIKAPEAVDQALLLIESLATYGASLICMIALFSLVPSKSDTGYKIMAVAVIGYFIHAIISIVLLFVRVDYNSLIREISSVITSIYTIAEYGFFVYYLLNKSPNMVAELVDKTPKTEPPQEVEQPVQQQPIQQPVPQQPVTPPQFGNPVVQPQVQQQPAPQHQVTPPPFGTPAVPQQMPPQPVQQYTPNPFK